MRQSSLLLPTSDFEEEYSSDKDDISDHLLCISLENPPEECQTVNILLSRAGVRIVPDGEVDNLRQLLIKTVLPIQFNPCQQTGLREEQDPSRHGLVSGLGEYQQEIPVYNNLIQPQLLRSLPPVICNFAATAEKKVRREKTFVEEKLQTAVKANKTKVEHTETQTENFHQSTEHIETLTEFVNTEENVPPESKKPTPQVNEGVKIKPELTNTAAQTELDLSKNSDSPSPPEIADDKSDMSGKIFLDKLSLESDTLEDEMVFRVLLEHVNAGDNDNSEDREDIRSPMSESSTTILEDSSILSDASNKDIFNDRVMPEKDLSRTVNYLDLSRIGNEGETPNSDEIWVTVEDDNKFLTSDTETYSVATDKVSTMATFKGHSVGSGFVENISTTNSSSEKELAQICDNDDKEQEYFLQKFGALLKYRIRPIESRLDTTGRAVSEIAETLNMIQVNQALLSYDAVFYPNIF